MATILEFPVTRLAPSKNRWAADEDLQAEIIELSDHRQSPLEAARQWQAVGFFNANLCLD